MRRISKDKVNSIIFADSNAQKVGWDFTLGGLAAMVGGLVAIGLGLVITNGASDMFIAKNDNAKKDVDGLYSNLLGPGD